MKEYIIQLTKGKEAILTLPINCTVSDIRYLIQQLPIEVRSHCKHDETMLYKRDMIVRCKGCGKQIN